MSENDSIIKITPASKELQDKAGTGELPEEKIRQAATTLEESAGDFREMAGEYLGRLETVIAEAQAGEGDVDQFLKKVTVAVMDIKASAQTFKYPLISELAYVTLALLESVRELDDSLFELLRLQNRTIKVMLSFGIRDRTHGDGKKFYNEYMAACDRYGQKHSRNLK